MNEKSVRITDPGKSPTPAQIKKWLGEEAYRYWIRMNEEPRSPESLRDEVSYRKELLFPYSLANPAASCEECVRYPIQWIDQNYPNVFTPDWIFGGKKHGLNKLDSRFRGNDGPFRKPYCMESLYLLHCTLRRIALDFLNRMRNNVKDSRKTLPNCLGTSRKINDQGFSFHTRYRP